MRNGLTSEWCEQVSKPSVVLVVDDDENDRDLLKRAIEPFYCDVIEADSGEQALAMLATRQDVKLILLDEAMPGMKGLEVFKRLRHSDSRIRVIFLTGHVHTLIEDLSKVGFATVVSKTALIDGRCVVDMMQTLGYPRRPQNHESVSAH